MKAFFLLSSSAGRGWFKIGWFFLGHPASLKTHRRAFSLSLSLILFSCLAHLGGDSFLEILRLESSLRFFGAAL